MSSGTRIKLRENILWLFRTAESKEFGKNISLWKKTWEIVLDKIFKNRYYVDKYSGFVADVTYEGVAKTYNQAPAPVPAPYRFYPYGRWTKSIMNQFCE